MKLSKKQRKAIEYRNSILGIGNAAESALGKMSMDGDGGTAEKKYTGAASLKNIVQPFNTAFVEAGGEWGNAWREASVVVGMHPDEPTEVNGALELFILSYPESHILLSSLHPLTEGHCRSCFITWQVFRSSTMLRVLEDTSAP